MNEETPKYQCIHEELIQNHSLEITEMKSELNYKKEKIDEIKKSMKEINEKLDQLILQSERSDFDIDTRVTQLETTQKTLKWIIGIGLTCIGTAVAVLSFIVTIIH